jgi:hypothetical protein
MLAESLVVNNRALVPDRSFSPAAREQFRFQVQERQTFAILAPNFRLSFRGTI